MQTWRITFPIEGPHASRPAQIECQAVRIAPDGVLVIYGERPAELPSTNVWAHEITSAYAPGSWRRVERVS